MVRALPLGGMREHRAKVVWVAVSAPAVTLVELEGAVIAGFLLAIGAILIGWLLALVMS